MAGQAGDYHRGAMDIHMQQATFHLVMGITKWGSLTVACAVLFLTLLFCTGAGFLAALVSAVVVAAIGGAVLGRRAQPAH
ncbi:MAG: aa3-type cytochrome c oxidase subunit IV [Caulobacteraceae bacterium]|nr:aa3-type cytochrome c oxidase subunit IV [Caulobacteraceae bacterium]